MFHTACPFTGEAQCFCPHGTALLSEEGSFPTSAQQQVEVARNAHQLYGYWRDSSPQLQQSVQRHTEEQRQRAATEMMLPRLFRNPASVDLGNELPIRVRGELLTRNQALMKLEEATLEAKRVVALAAQHAAYAGVPYKPPADFGVDPSSIEHPKDLKILQEIASGSVVEAAKRGGLTEAQEQQLLGLSPQDYNQLRSIRADVAQQGERLLKAEAAAAAQRQQQAARGPEEAGPLHGQQAAGGRDSRPPSGVDGPSNAPEGRQQQPPGGPMLIQPQELNQGLKGQMLLIQVPNNAQWHKACVEDVDAEGRLAKLSFQGYKSVIAVDLMKTAQERRLARPEAPSGSVGQQQAGRRHPSAQEAGPRLQQQQHISPQVPQQQMTQQGMQRVMAQRQQHKSPAVASPSMNVFAGYIGMQAASQAPPAQPAQNMASRSGVATCMTSVVERLLAAGPKATGCNVEVVLLSTGQRRNGIVSMCYPADRIVAINFGHMTANLEAAEEFKTYTMKILGSAQSLIPAAT